MIMVNGSTNYGSLTSLVSPEDVGLGTSQRRRKKFSVSSMMSSFSNTSDQPYLSLMSNLGERKLSSLSACGSVITKQSSEESVVSKTSSDNKYPVSNKKEVGQASSEDYDDDNFGTAEQNQKIPRRKKSSLRKMSSRESTKRKVEIFPGYVEHVQERAKMRPDILSEKGRVEQVGNK